MNQNLLNIISALPSNTNFYITKKFFSKFSLVVTNSQILSFGHYFSKNYSKYGCKKNIVSPNQGTASNKSSNNLCHYTKI